MQFVLSNSGRLFAQSSFTIFTKVGTNRLTQIVHIVVKLTQIAFMPGRHILEGLVVLHEALHEIHSKKLDGVILKVYFGKAYDKIKWSFLQQGLRMNGFDSDSRKQVQAFVQGGNVWVKVNDKVGHYFKTKKRLCQGDLLSPIF
jgi:hypothetical protein